MFKSKKKQKIEPNPSEVDLKSLKPKEMKRKQLVETLQKLNIDSKGKIGELKGISYQISIFKKLSVCSKKYDRFC